MDIKQLQVQQLMEKVINKLYNKNKNKILLKYKVFNQKVKMIIIQKVGNHI